MPKKVEIHEENRLFDDVFAIDEARLQFERFDGSMSEPVRRLCFERGDSVAAVVRNRDTGALLLTEQFRYPTYEKGPGWLVEIVAGVIEDGETPEASLRREIREEMGYDVAHLEPIATFYVSPGGSSERILLYYAEVTDDGKVGAGGGADEEGEDIRLVTLTPDALDARLAAGDLADAKTLVGVLWLKAQDAAG